MLKCCNTFEVVLLSDGSESFIMFNYGTIRWTQALSGHQQAQVSNIRLLYAIRPCLQTLSDSRRHLQFFTVFYVGL